MIKYFLLVLVFAVNISHAQVVFSFLPEVYGKTIEGLGVFQTQNFSGEVKSGSIIISLYEKSINRKIFSITIQNVSIQLGVRTFEKNRYASGSINFIESPISSIVKQTKIFPPGDYLYCYQFLPDNKSFDQDENWFEATLEPAASLSLINPDDGDTICSKRPTFTWRLLPAYNPQIKYKLLVCEKTQEDPYECILNNVPLLLLTNISSTTVNYPAGFPDLKEDKSYCWQVVAYQQGVLISSSEVYQFTINCFQKPTPPVLSDVESYRELKLMVNGNYYIANKVLRFSFFNNYEPATLNYSIVDIDKGMRIINNIPVIVINRGLNKIDIDLTDLDMVPNKQYLLRVKPFNSPQLEVRFVYHN